MKAGDDVVESFSSRSPLVAVMLSTVAVAQVLVSMLTWYGVVILQGRELNPIFGYSPLIEVGRPFFAILFGMLLVTGLRRPAQRLLGLSTFLGAALADLSYDLVYIVGRGQLLAMGTGIAVACLVPIICILWARRTSWLASMTDRSS